MPHYRREQLKLQAALYLVRLPMKGYDSFKKEHFKMVHSNGSASRLNRMIEVDPENLRVAIICAFVGRRVWYRSLTGLGAKLNLF